MTKKINSRNKGNRFERDVAKWFEKWSGYEFGRIPGSGSLRWQKTDNIVGDITCTDAKHSRRFPFSVECKFYKDLNFEHILLGNKSCDIIKFWEQCKGDAERANKVPFLVMRYNSMPKEQYFIMVKEDFFKGIKKHLPKDSRYMNIKIESETVNVIMATDIIQTKYINSFKAGRNIVKANIR